MLPVPLLGIDEDARLVVLPREEALRQGRPLVRRHRVARDDEHVVRVTLRELLRRIPGDHAAAKDDVLRAAACQSHRLLSSVWSFPRRTGMPRTVCSGVARTVHIGRLRLLRPRRRVSVPRRYSKRCLMAYAVASAFPRAPIFA